MIWKTKFKIIKINDRVFDVIKMILISEKEFTETNYKRLPKSLIYIGNNLIDSDGGIDLTVESLT